VISLVNPHLIEAAVTPPVTGTPDDLPSLLPFVLGSTATTSKFPGHVANRVLVGMASPSDGGNRPAWTEAQTLIGQPIYEARRFEPSWINTTDFNKMVGEADDANALPVISFKVPGDNWAGIPQGVYDADL
jgi:hypothetical protein